MLIIPAIDILDGQCVRLYKGKYDQATHYSLDPVETALSYENAGAIWIHLVDLDGARGRGKNNRSTIRAIRAATRCKIETGGGIRTQKDIEDLLEIGVNKLILGTVLIKEPEMAAGWVRQYGDVFAAGIDALDGQVRVSGWEAGSGMKDTDLAVKAGSMGLTGIVYTSISRDGTFQGPDIKGTNRVADAAGSREDVEKIAADRCGWIKGVIVGKAIYENKVNIREILSSYQSEQDDRNIW
jgi:phosphoribosylformimino-5-aminoimidazole carboxamide ribotide isomerase